MSLMKELLSVLLLLTLTVGLTACAGEEGFASDPIQTTETDSVPEPTQEPEPDSVPGSSQEPEAEPETWTTEDPELSWESGSVELEEPWVYCGDDMAEAVKIAGFNLSMPPLSNFTVAVIPGEMIEVTYPRDEFDKIVVRKSPGEPEEGDISGDDNEYPETGVITVNGADVSVRRDGDTIYVAAFTAADGVYCVSCAAGMTEKEVTQTLAELMEANAK